MTQDQRRFNRVQFDHLARLQTAQAVVSCQIVDLSIHGVLIRLPDDQPIPKDNELPLTIPLSDEDDSFAIRMMIKLVARHKGLLHCECTHIDLDSLTHLRRLVELNTGQPELLERELANLCQ